MTGGNLEDAVFIDVYSISILFSVIFLVVVVVLVRKNMLQERYSILWVFMSLILLVLSSTPLIMEELAGWLGIRNAPSLLFLFGLVYLLIYNLHITTVVSRQSERIMRLTQEIALMKHTPKEKDDTAH